MPLPFTKAGKISQYGLACGHCQTEQSDGLRLSLWQEHNAYHVRLYDHWRGMRAAWNVYEKLTEARAFYDQVHKVQFGESHQ